MSHILIFYLLSWGIFNSMEKFLPVLSLLSFPLYLHKYLIKHFMYYIWPRLEYKIYYFTYFDCLTTWVLCLNDRVTYLNAVHLSIKHFLPVFELLQTICSGTSLFVEVMYQICESVNRPTTSYLYVPILAKFCMHFVSVCCFSNHTILKYKCSAS